MFYSYCLQNCRILKYQTQLPAKEKPIPDYTFITQWEPISERRYSNSWLSTSMIPSGMDAQTIPVAYSTHNYMISHADAETSVHAMLSHMVRSLILLHTHRIYHDFHDGFFGVAYNNLLERLWCCFASDAALGKLGAREHCGRVFEAMAERKDKKRFCSTECQENAKSARNYRKKKIREAIQQECTTDVEYLLHILDDPKITRGMVEAVLKENKLPFRQKS